MDRTKSTALLSLLLAPLYALAILPISALGESDTESKQSQLIVAVILEGNKTPVAKARVIVTGPNELERSGTTDSDGEATFAGLPRERLTIQVVATGLETQGVRVQLSKAVEKTTVTLKKSHTLPEPVSPSPNAE